MNFKTTTAKSESQGEQDISALGILLIWQRLHKAFPKAKSSVIHLH